MPLSQEQIQALREESTTKLAQDDTGAFPNIEYFYNTNINCYSVRCEGTVFIYSKSDNDRCFRRSEKRCPGKYAK